MRTLSVNHDGNQPSHSRSSICLILSLLRCLPIDQLPATWPQTPATSGLAKTFKPFPSMA